MKLRLSIATGVAAICTSLLALISAPQPNPTGTRPTQLTNLVVAANGSAMMNVSGKLSDINGVGLAGRQIKIYEAGVAYFATLGTVYTGNSGTFTWSGTKNSVGTKVQIEAVLSGSHSTPFPTFNRP